MMFIFNLPDVGEGLTEAEIVVWRVQPGDVVSVNDPLVEIETAKSIVEIPSPFAGTIETLHGESGATIAVHSPLVTIRTADDVEHGTAGDSAETESALAVEQKPLVLVGTGPTAAATRRFHLARRSSPSLVAASVSPPLRSRARRLGIDLAALAERGPITRSAVENAVGSAAEPSHSAALETRIPIKGVRKATAKAVVASAFTAPHVTEWLSVDVTSTMEVVHELRNDSQWQDVRVTPLLLVANALLLAVRRYPEINASWDEAAQEIIVKHYVNLGIAAATPRGLLVPNIKDADRMTFRDLAGSLGDLVATAKSGSSTPADLARGTITITNIGALGVDAGTPILNPGEAAILAFGQVRPMPWVVAGAVVPRQVAQLALSFDHRMVDGELGSHVLAEVGRILSSPWRAGLLA